MIDNLSAKKFRVTRWKQLVFPREIIIDEKRVMTRKRRFPAFWIITEESIPLRSVAAIHVNKGLLFSSILIENSGGPYPIEVDGIPNRLINEIRYLIEDYNPLHYPERKAEPTESDSRHETAEKSERTSKRPAFKPFIRKTTGRKVHLITDGLNDDLWSEPDESRKFDPLGVNAQDFDESREPEYIVKQNKTQSFSLDDDDLPSLDEVAACYDKKSVSPGWMDDLIKSPKSARGK